jgi:hypothetical protein
VENDPRYKEIQRQSNNRLQERAERDRQRARDYTPMEFTPYQFLALTGRSYEYAPDPMEGGGKDFTEAMLKFMAKVDDEIDINPPPLKVHVFALEKCLKDLKARKIIPVTAKRVSFEQFVLWLYNQVFPEE